MITFYSLIFTGSLLVLFYSSYYGFTLIKSREKRSKKEYSTTISIVVPVYNEEKTIERKLENLNQQDYTGDMEIVVIDSGSVDTTLQLVRKAAKNTPMKVIEQKERKGKASALNMAFPQCSGDIVVMTDADALWEKTTLREAINNFSDPSVGAVTGRQILLNPDQTSTTKIEKTYRNFYEILRIGESVIDSTPIFHGEISCYRKNLLEPVSEDSMADDSELAVKTRKKGFRSIYDPDTIFYEYAPPTQESRYIQKVRRGQGLLQLFLRQWKMLFNRKYGKFGLIVYPAEFFMHVVSPVVVFMFVALLIWNAFLNVYVGYVVGIGVGLLLLSYIVKRGVFDIAATFLQSQGILLISLFYFLAGKSQNIWPQVEEIRQLWQEEPDKGVKGDKDQ
jgi:cellulose synthase/poly-beta-1,6-N-acetylglucosamine synthase-like glycosyltransferase